VLRIEASVTIDGSRTAEEGAHLRWFIASDATRGRGVGRALLREALAFCDERGAQWGREVNEQLFVRRAPGGAGAGGA